jgi:mRNA interferase MazF
MAGRRQWIPGRQDMIWIDCNPQAGRQMRDMHPLLVLSPRAFNERTGIVIGLPLSTAGYNLDNPFAVPFPGSGNKTGFVLTHQPNSFDWRACHARPHPWKRVPDAVYSACCASLNQIIDLAG